MAHSLPVTVWDSMESMRRLAGEEAQVLGLAELYGEDWPSQPEPPAPRAAFGRAAAFLLRLPGHPALRPPSF